jgi:hypothetical protein
MDPITTSKTMHGRWEIGVGKAIVLGVERTTGGPAPGTVATITATAIPNFGPKKMAIVDLRANVAQLRELHALMGRVLADMEGNT